MALTVNGLTADGFFDPHSAVLAVQAGNRALLDTDEPTIPSSGLKDAITNVVLAALVTLSDEEWSDLALVDAAYPSIPEAGLRHVLRSIAAEAAEVALAEYGNLVIDHPDLLATLAAGKTPEVTS